MRKWLAPLCIVAAFATSALVWTRLPDRVPVHWDAHGTVNGYGSRFAGALMLPAAMLGLWLLLRVLPRIDPRRANYAKFADTYDLIVNSLVALFLVMHLALLASALGWPVSMERVAPVLVGLQFLILGNALPRARPNWWFGIRTPWTLSNDRVWARTHRVAGYLLAGAGAVLLLIGAFAPTSLAFALGVGAVVAASVGSLVYSYFAWRQETSK
jgi:immunity protein, SdpI family